MRTFSVDQASGAEFVVGYVGDVDHNGSLTARDARRIVNAAMGRDNPALTALERKLADVDNNGNLTARDARRVVNAAMERGDPIDW